LLLNAFFWLYLAVCIREIQRDRPRYYRDLSFWRPLWIACTQVMQGMWSVFVHWYCLMI